jgi:hypothetical protein
VLPDDKTVKFGNDLARREFSHGTLNFRIKGFR